MRVEVSKAWCTYVAVVIAFSDVSPGTSPVIKGGLKLLLSDHLAFSNEVLERAPPSLLADGNAVVDVITNALQHGIETFSQ